MSAPGRTGTWVQVDALWLYIGGLDGVASPVEANRLTLSGSVDGVLIDPLLGSREEIERYLAQPRHRGGDVVRLGSNAIGWHDQSGGTEMVYRFWRGRLRWEVRIGIQDSTRRHPHKRRFITGHAPIRGSVSTRRLAQPTHRPSVVFASSDELAQDIARLTEIHQSVSQLIRPSP
jgi:hypothetical protein